MPQWLMDMIREQQTWTEFGEAGLPGGVTTEEGVESNVEALTELITDPTNLLYGLGGVGAGAGLLKKVFQSTRNLKNIPKASNVGVIGDEMVDILKLVEKINLENAKSLKNIKASKAITKPQITHVPGHGRSETTYPLKITERDLSSMYTKNIKPPVHVPTKIIGHVPSTQIEIHRQNMLNSLLKKIWPAGLLGIEGDTESFEGDDLIDWENFIYTER